jgi:two-component system, LytTR family, sensor kinase
VGLFFTSQHMLFAQTFLGQPAAWSRSILATLPDWYLWGALTPLIALFSRRFPLERARLAARVPLHLLAGAVVALLHLSLAASMFLWIEPVPRNSTTWREQFDLNFVVVFHWNVLIYAMIVAVTHAMTYLRRSREEKQRAWQLEARLALARLETLQVQLQPHFLFNTLNTVSELIHERPEAAEAMTIRLADLLRLTLDGAAQQTVRLIDELGYVGKYLEIEQVRFEDRLSVRWLIEKETHAAIVPRLFLQPLVENAVRHGVSRVSRRGLIEVSARRVDGLLMIQVRDNGFGLRDPRAECRTGGVGLENTRARLEQLYGAAASLTLRAGDEQGVVATVILPFKTANPSAVSISTLGVAT